MEDYLWSMVKIAKYSERNDNWFQITQGDTSGDRAETTTTRYWDTAFDLNMPLRYLMHTQDSRFRTVLWVRSCGRRTGTWYEIFCDLLHHFQKRMFGAQLQKDTYFCHLYKKDWSRVKKVQATREWEVLLNRIIFLLMKSLPYLNFHFENIFRLRFIEPSALWTLTHCRLKWSKTCGMLHDVFGFMLWFL